MKVKHIAADGHVRRTFDNVNSIYRNEGNVVSVSALEITVSPKKEPFPEGNTRWQYQRYSYEYPIALIHLAPGESLERVDEPTEPARS